MSKKSKSKHPTLSWADAPAEHDYPAAVSFLSLIATPVLAQSLSSLMRQAPVVHQAAKDILRAARLPLLSAKDPEVAKDLKKVSKGTPLAPVLLIRGDLYTDRPLQIADGYHRVCASYHLDEDAEIPCLLVDPPASPVMLSPA